jgi:hypothetical protein
LSTISYGFSSSKARGIHLPGRPPRSLPSTASLSSFQLDRFKSTSFTSSRALSISEIRKRYLPSEERERVASLEMLDEIEELELLLGHYFVAWGRRTPQVDGDGDGGRSDFEIEPWPGAST